MDLGSTSAVIVRNEDNKVFVAKRSSNKEYSPGKWETIGGRIDQEETAEEGLKREIKEELGVNIVGLEFFKDYLFNDNGKERVFKTYIVKLADEPKPNFDDFDDWGWKTEDEIKNLDFAINCLERLLDYFKIVK